MVLEVGINRRVKEELDTQESRAQEQTETQELAVQKFKAQFSADQELIQGIERAKELLSNKLRAAPSMEDVFKVIINEYIEQNTPKASK